MLDKEKLLIEQRLAEATTNDFRGLDGKFGIILKTLGHPIVSEETTLYNSTEWQDIYEIPTENEDIPTADGDMSIREIGKMFDGLRFGAHIEITYLQEGLVPEKRNGAWGEFTKYSIEEKVLTVSYKSYPVYREIDGELHQYLPNEEWQSEINRIYQFALKIRNQRKQEFFEEMKEKDKTEKLGFIGRLRERWGI